MVLQPASDDAKFMRPVIPNRFPTVCIGELLPWTIAIRRTAPKDNRHLGKLPPAQLELESLLLVALAVRGFHIYRHLYFKTHGTHGCN